MNPLIPVLAAGGAVAYYVTQADTAPATPLPKPGPPKVLNPPSGSTLAIALQMRAQEGLPPLPTVQSYKPLTPGFVLTTSLQSAYTQLSASDPELKKKFDLAERLAEEQFKNMNEVAKAKAADALNKQLKLDPPLTGHEDWKTVASVVGATAGAAAGAWIGGPVGAKIGALVGAYLGVKIEDFVEKNWDEVQAWAKGKWSWAKDKLSDVWDDSKGVVDDVVDWFGDLF
jgi:uncharacterized protein YcfJ